MKHKYGANWLQKSLENLEKNIWASLSSDEGSYLIRTCHELRKKQLQDFTIEDLRIMIGQEIGLLYLVPIALEKLTDNLFAEGDMYEGDLLNNVLNIEPTYWKDHKTEKLKLQDLIKDRRSEIKQMKIETIKFDNCQE